MGKNILRKQIAFISAISFLSANFVPMGAIAAETTTQPTSSAITETTVTTTDSTTQSTTVGITDVDAAVTGETVVHIGNSEFSVVECPTQNGASFNPKENSEEFVITENIMIINGNPHAVRV